MRDHVHYALKFVGAATKPNAKVDSVVQIAAPEDMIEGVDPLDTVTTAAATAAAAIATTIAAIAIIA